MTGHFPAVPCGRRQTSGDEDLQTGFGSGEFALTAITLCAQPVGMIASVRRYGLEPHEFAISRSVSLRGTGAAYRGRLTDRCNERPFAAGRAYRCQLPCSGVLRHLRDGVLAASTAYNALGDRQVLVFGSCNLEILVW